MENSYRDWTRQCLNNAIDCAAHGRLRSAECVMLAMQNPATDNWYSAYVLANAEANTAQFELEYALRWYRQQESNHA